MNRELWIDRCKGLLILLVVIGHVVGGGHEIAHGTAQWGLQFLYKVIYAFHMPAFFLLAGLTFGTRGTWAEFVSKKIRRLIIPYLVFGLFSAIVWWVVGGVVASAISSVTTTGYYGSKACMPWWYPIVGLLHGGGAPSGEGFRANSVLWFLPCMFSTLICFRAVVSIGERKRRIALYLLAFGLAWAMTYFRCFGWPWGLSKVPYYLIFMGFGYEVGVGVARGWKRWALALGGMGLFLLLIWVYPNPIVTLRRWFWFPCFIPLALLGIYVCIVWAKVLPFRFLAVCGEASMTIMLLHKFVVMGLQLKVGLIMALFKGGVVEALLGTVAVTVVSVVLCLVADWFLRKLAPWSIGR